MYIRMHIMTILVAAPYALYRLIVLDPVLCDALQQKGAVLPEQMAWAQLMERLVFPSCNE